MLRKIGGLIHGMRNASRQRCRYDSFSKKASLEGVVLNAPQVKSLLQTWIKRVQINDLAGVLALYAPHAVVHPTFQNKMIRQEEGRIAYFTMFLSRRPRAKILQNKTYSRVNLAINTGLYRFKVIDQGKRATVTARYTFTYEYLDGQWVITSHLSAQAPCGRTIKS